MLFKFCKYFSLLIFSLLFYSCDDNAKLNKQIVEYEKGVNKEVKAIKCDDKLLPFYGSDSIKILKDELASFLDKKHKEIELSIKNIHNRISLLNLEIKNGNNSKINKIRINRIKRLEEEEDRLLFIDSLYYNCPEETQANVYKSIIKKYTPKTDSVIGFRCNATIQYKIGQLPKQYEQKIYLLSKDKRSIKGVLR